MQRVRVWLGGELTRVRVAEREIAVKRIHLTTLLLVLAIAIVAIVLAFAAGRYVYPYRTVPAPPVPKGQTIPDCQAQPNGSHSAGACLPQPPAVGQANTADIVSSSLGPDLSNNDPVYGSTSWRTIAGRNSFAIFKVNESTGYVDPTAKPMADAAKAAGIVVSGYDFLHICLVSPTAEAHVFAVYLRQDGLTGPRTLPPIGDVEYPPSTACNVRSWLTAWIGEVHKELGRWPGLYTGAWWWDPHIGSWWPAHVNLAWVSGYTGSLSAVPRPAGRSQIDLWQLSDHGFNGATYADLSQWEDGVRSFRAWARETPVKPRVVCWGKHSTPQSAACKKVEAQAHKLWAGHLAFNHAIPHWEGIVRPLEAKVHQLQQELKRAETALTSGQKNLKSREYWSTRKKQLHDQLVSRYHA